MQSSAAPPRPFPLPRFLGDASGATAVEFGLVSIPFFALLGAILQIAFMTWAQENLDFTFQKAARSVFTGQFQTDPANSGATTTTLLQAIHDQMCGPSSSNGKSTVYNCAGAKVDLKIGTNFANTTFQAPVNPNTRAWATGFGTNYTCAAPGAIVIATAAVEFPLFFRLWDLGLSSFSDGGVLLQSTAVFRTEPYRTSGASPC
ncbi:TadE/TadG family type IV pilus assembly protein [Lichenibacterium dinghuense]|uniref:TadE/TadG family type IV pilus assembly protein n=1 Tax=Lichenibacterium dinghuense TaxID=2895977 RepID=UPI001F4432DF|nr:TadE/TadG family type IV pilus assembly protein [Lichenibacterium sp. 6Y81]